MLEDHSPTPVRVRIDAGIANAPMAPARFAAARVVLALMAGPFVTVIILAGGGSARTAHLLGVIGGWWALWTIRELPVHFAPLLALLVMSLFSLEPASALMVGFGMEGFWWILGSWMLALAAWETGLVGVLMAPQRGARILFCRLLAGLAGLYGTRAALLLKSLVPLEPRAAHICFTLGRMVGLPSHVLNLFALTLLPMASIERYSLVNWVAAILPLAAALAFLSAMQNSPMVVEVEDVFECSPSVCVTPLQSLAAIALLVAWAGAASGTLHGLPPGIWFLYLGLMTIAAGLLSVAKFWRDINWPLWLALGAGIGLAKIVASVLTPIFTEIIAGSVGAPQPLMVAFALIGVSALVCRQLGILRSALIMLPVALALAAASGGDPAGWMLLVLMTHHWLDIFGMNGMPAGRDRWAAAAICLAGLALIGVAAVIWFHFGVL
jgi:hypothetical protein